MWEPSVSVRSLASISEICNLALRIGHEVRELGLPTVVLMQIRSDMEGPTGSAILPFAQIAASPNGGAFDGALNFRFALRARKGLGADCVSPSCIRGAIQSWLS